MAETGVALIQLQKLRRRLRHSKIYARSRYTVPLPRLPRRVLYAIGEKRPRTRDGGRGQVWAKYGELDGTAAASPGCFVVHEIAVAAQDDGG